MLNSETEGEQRLRVVRFFLPRLTKDQLGKELSEQKRHVTSDFERQKAAVREQGERRKEEEQRATESQKEQAARKRSRWYVAGALLTTLSIIGAVVWGLYAAEQSPEMIGPAAVAGVGGVTFVFLLAALARARSLSGIIQRLEESLKERINAITQEVNRDIAAKESSLQKKLRALARKLDRLYELYERSIADEDEVADFASNSLHEVREQACPALGIDERDVMDRESAEVWSPTFLQTHSLPTAVLNDIARSTEEVRQLRDQIVGPLREAFDEQEEQLWNSFKSRVQLLLGLREDSAGGSDMTEGPDNLSALTAIRFSEKGETYLAGHYFFQRILCSEDCVNVFRAYANVLSGRMPHSFAIKIPYSDIVSIGVETAQNLERYPASGMTVDQHTHSLGLELPSGAVYRMSGDAGSTASVWDGGDTGIREVVSKANAVFREQIINVRALILDAKRARSVVGRDDV